MVQLIEDPCFPQISKVLDVNYIKQLFQINLFKDQKKDVHSIIACEAGEKRHKPGKSFQLSYNIKISDSFTGACYEQTLTAKLYPAGQNGIASYEEYPDGYWQLPAGIRPVTYIPDVNAEFRAFPFDPKLLHLPKLQDADYLIAYFNRNPAIIEPENDEKIAAIAIKVMHYLPGQSCMTRYSLTVTSPASERKIIIYGKNYKDDSGAETFSVMRQLSVQLEDCAKPLYYDCEIKTLWQLHTDGVPFSWDECRFNFNRKLVATVAKSIASFHSSNLVTTRFYRIKDIISQLNASCEIAPMVRPATSQKIKDAVHEILNVYKYVDWTDQFHAPIHMDLKMGNVLISNNRAVLIDMDSAGAGDPLADFGSFIANVYMNGLCSGAKLAEIDPVIALLIDEYRSVVKFPVRINKLYWYISAALIHEVVRRSLRQQSQFRLKHLEDFIELGKRYCELCSPSAMYNADAMA